jgi:hypothetical protein
LQWEPQTQHNTGICEYNKLFLTGLFTDFTITVLLGTRWQLWALPYKIWIPALVFIRRAEAKMVKNHSWRHVPVTQLWIIGASSRFPRKLFLFVTEHYSVFIFIFLNSDHSIIPMTTLLSSSFNDEISTETTQCW